jgi:hypothetical protein
MKELNETRRNMIENNENLGWCKPLYFEARKMWLVLHEGEVDSVLVDGVEVPFESLEISLDDLLGEDHIEEGCYKCPWFMTCDAMDD